MSRATLFLGAAQQGKTYAALNEILSKAIIESLKIKKTTDPLTGEMLVEIESIEMPYLATFSHMNQSRLTCTLRKLVGDRLWEMGVDKGLVWKIQDMIDYRVLNFGNIQAGFFEGKKFKSILIDEIGLFPPTADARDCMLELLRTKDAHFIFTGDLNQVKNSFWLPAITYAAYTGTGQDKTSSFPQVRNFFDSILSFNGSRVKLDKGNLVKDLLKIPLDWEIQEIPFDPHNPHLTEQRNRILEDVDGGSYGEYAGAMPEPDDIDFTDTWVLTYTRAQQYERLQHFYPLPDPKQGKADVSWVKWERGTEYKFGGKVGLAVSAVQSSSERRKRFFKYVNGQTFKITGVVEKKDRRSNEGIKRLYQLKRDGTDGETLEVSEYEMKMDFLPVGIFCFTKGQGGNNKNIIIDLPGKQCAMPVEYLYTGATRAVESLTVVNEHEFDLGKCLKRNQLDQMFEWSRYQRQDEVHLPLRYKKERSALIRKFIEKGLRKREFKEYLETGKQIPLTFFLDTVGKSLTEREREWVGQLIEKTERWVDLFSQRRSLPHTHYLPLIKYLLNNETDFPYGDLFDFNVSFFSEFYGVNSADLANKKYEASDSQMSELVSQIESLFTTIGGTSFRNFHFLVGRELGAHVPAPILQYILNEMYVSGKGWEHTSPLADWENLLTGTMMSTDYYDKLPALKYRCLRETCNRLKSEVGKLKGEESRKRFIDSKLQDFPVSTKIRTLEESKLEKLWVVGIKRAGENQGWTPLQRYGFTNDPAESDALTYDQALHLKAELQDTGSCSIPQGKNCVTKVTLNEGDQVALGRNTHLSQPYIDWDYNHGLRDSIPQAELDKLQKLFADLSTSTKAYLNSDCTSAHFWYETNRLFPKFTIGYIEVFGNSSNYLEWFKDGKEFTPTPTAKLTPSTWDRLLEYASTFPVPSLPTR